GHHEVEDDAIDAGLAAGQDGEREVAAFGDHRLLAGAGDHVLDPAAGKRAVVDDQDALRHGLPLTPAHNCLATGQLWPIGLKVLLSLYESATGKRAPVHDLATALASPHRRRLHGVANAIP